MAKVKKKPTNAGGKREGAGQFSPFGEKTQVASYRVPISKIEIFDSAATAMLEQWKIKDGEKDTKKEAREAWCAKSLGFMNSTEPEKFTPIIPKEEIRGVIEEHAKKMYDDAQKIAPNLHFGKNCKLNEEEMDKAIDEVLSEQFKEEVQPQPEIIVYDSEDEKGVEVVFPKEEKEEIYNEGDHAKLNQEPRYSEAFIESLLNTACAKYKTGKIIKEVGTNEEYRLAYGLDFDRESDNIVMGGTSIEKGIYKSRVVLFSNDEWAKF